MPLLFFLSGCCPSPVADTSSASYCTKCGKQNPAESAFCAKCGNKLWFTWVPQERAFPADHQLLQVTKLLPSSLCECSHGSLFAVAIACMCVFITYTRLDMRRCVFLSKRSLNTVSAHATLSRMRPRVVVSNMWWQGLGNWFKIGVMRRSCSQMFQCMLVHVREGSHSVRKVKVRQWKIRRHL